MHTEGQECMKVLKRVDEDLLSLNGKATRRKAELVALEKTVQKQNKKTVQKQNKKTVQKQNKKMLKLMGRINSALERIDKLEDLAETRDRRIRNLEEKVEDLESKALSRWGLFDVCCPVLISLREWRSEWSDRNVMMRME